MSYEYPTQEALVQALEEAFHFMKELGGESNNLLGYNSAYLQIEETLNEVKRADRSKRYGWLLNQPKHGEANHA